MRKTNNKFVEDVKSRLSKLTYSELIEVFRSEYLGMSRQEQRLLFDELNARDVEDMPNIVGGSQSSDPADDEDSYAMRDGGGL
jgi:hypothetical protein